MLKQHGKEFINILQHLKPSKHTYEVFSDWLIMAAASLYSYKNDERVESEYMEIAKQYSKEELLKHSQLLDLTVNALEEKEQDFLGEIFTNAELTNARGGQFFTPYHVSYMCAKMTISEKELPNSRILRINDPTCGAGGMLIAGAQVLKEIEFDYQQNALFIGQDIDARCARMTYIQLSLLGVPAVVYCMNTLSMQEFWHRETIGYWMSGMEYRLRTERLIDNMQELTSQKSITEKLIDINITTSKNFTQAELF